VDALLEAHRGAGGAPLSLVPRVALDGTINIEILQPVTATCSARSGQTAVLAMAGLAPGSLPRNLTRPDRESL